MTQDTSAKGAIPQPATTDGGNGHDRTRLDDRVGEGARYDCDVRATDRTEQKPQETGSKSADERAREISNIDGLLNQLENSPKPATSNMIREQLRDAEKGYKTMGIDVEKLTRYEFIKTAYVSLHNLINNSEKIVKEGKKGLESFRDQLDSIRKLIKDGLYGKDYTSTNKKPSGLYGDHNIAIVQRLMTDTAMTEVERILNELNIETQKCKEKIANTSLTEVGRIQALVNEQTERMYHVNQLENRMVVLEYRFCWYDSLVAEKSKNIETSEALYQHVLEYKQNIVGLLIKYPKDEESDNAIKALAKSEFLSELIRVMERYIRKIKQRTEIVYKRDTALAESAIGSIGDPLIVIPLEINPSGIIPKEIEGIIKEREDKITKRREEIRINPFAGSYLANYSSKKTNKQ